MEQACADIQVCPLPEGKERDGEREERRRGGGFSLVFDVLVI